MGDKLHQNKNQYIISILGVVDITLGIAKTYKEVKAGSAVDHICAEHKTQEDNNEITIQTVQNNVINAKPIQSESPAILSGER